MTLELEQRIERLQMVVKAYQAASTITDDAGEDFSMGTIVMEDVPKLITAIRAKDELIAGLKEDVAGAFKAAQIAINERDTRDVEIEKLKQISSDETGELTVECQILWELAADSDVADHHLSDFRNKAKIIDWIIEEADNLVTEHAILAKEEALEILEEAGSDFDLLLNNNAGSAATDTAI